MDRVGPGCGDGSSCDRQSAGGGREVTQDDDSGASRGAVGIAAVLVGSAASAASGVYRSSGVCDAVGGSVPSA